MREYTSAKVTEAVLLDDLLGSRAGVEGRNYSVEAHASATDADHAISIDADRNPLGWNLQFHEASVGGLQGGCQPFRLEPSTVRREC
jgi:hypothetical protein